MNKHHSCPAVSHADIAEAKLRLDAFNKAHPVGNVTADDVTLALAYSGPNDYFITTHLYWECQCAEDYFHRQDTLMCERCGALAEDCADARVHELRAAGIHLDCHDPAVLATMDEYNLGNKSAARAARLRTTRCTNRGGGSTTVACP